MATQESAQLLDEQRKIKSSASLSQDMVGLAWEVGLLIATVAVYLMTGTIFYWMAEKWPFFESFYFCVVTMTVNILPCSHARAPSASGCLPNLHMSR